MTRLNVTLARLVLMLGIAGSALIGNATLSMHAARAAPDYLDACMDTGATVTVDDPAWLTIAQQILNLRNTVVIIPKALHSAGTYHVSVTNDGQPITWSFIVAQ